MLSIVIGIIYGTAVGLAGNYLLFRRIDKNHASGVNPFQGVGTIFLLRYLGDAAALFLFAYVIKETWGIIAAALSVTVAVKISLLIVYMRKGGRFE